MREAAEVALVILGSLGGGGVIVFALSSWLGKMWANRLMARETAQHSRDLESLRSELLRNTESYRVKLKKSELIFEREFDAASELVSLIRGFLPTFRYPQMDWYEACDEIAHDFQEIEVRLNEFLSRHGAVLPDNVKDKIGVCIGMAGEEKFEIEGPEVPSHSNKVANDLFEKLWAAEEGMLSHVRAQTSI